MSSRTFLSSHGVPHASRANGTQKPRRRIERVADDNELPIVQCDCLVWKYTAATDRLKVLSMYAKPFGLGMFTVVETKGAGDSFAVMGTIRMLSSIGLSDIITKGDIESSPIKRAEGGRARRQERTVIRSSPR